MIRIISLLAIATKFISGLEIWGNTIGRGEFSIAIAVLFGSPAVATVIAAMVVVTSIVGTFTAK
jgi:CPA2 family monovalent cation:H+ antiporter-2